MATQFIDTATPTIGLKAGADIINNNGVESAYQGSYFASGGTANAITLTSSGGEAPSNYVVGQKMRFRVSSTNTGAATVSVDGLPITSLKTLDGNDLPASYLPTDREIEIVYDGVNFKVYPPVGTAPAQIPTNADRNLVKRKNYIINPSMAVSQESGDSNVVLAAGDPITYGKDQWASLNGAGTGATLTISTETLEGFNSYRVTATSAATDLSASINLIPHLHYIEASNVFHLNGKTITYSFLVRTNWTGNLPVAFRSGDGNRVYVTDVAVESGTKRVSVSIPLEASTVPNNGNGKGIDIFIGFNNEGDRRTSDSEQWITDDTLCTTNSTQWSKVSSNYVEATAHKLEESSVPSAFEPNSYTQDLAECQRYYWESDTLEGDPLFMYFRTSSGTTNKAFTISNPIRMRTNPVIEATVNMGSVSVDHASSTQTTLISDDTTTSALIRLTSFTANARL